MNKKLFLITTLCLFSSSVSWSQETGNNYIPQQILDDTTSSDEPVKEDTAEPEDMDEETRFQLDRLNRALSKAQKETDEETSSSFQDWVDSIPDDYISEKEAAEEKRKKEQLFKNLTRIAFLISLIVINYFLISLAKKYINFSARFVKTWRWMIPVTFGILWFYRRFANNFIFEIENILLMFIQIALYIFIVNTLLTYILMLVSPIFKKLHNKANQDE